MHKLYTILTRLRSQLLVFLTHNMALPMLRFIRRPQVFPFSATELQNFPAGTLGFDLVCFLKEKKLKLLPHYAKQGWAKALRELIAMLYAGQRASLVSCSRNRAVWLCNHARALEQISPGIQAWPKKYNDKEMAMVQLANRIHPITHS